MRKSIVFYLLVLFIANDVYSNEPAHKLMVSMHPLEPFVIADNNQPSAGFIVDIFNKMAHIVGYRGKVKLVSFARAKKRLRTSMSQYSPETGKMEYIYAAHLIMVRTQKREGFYKWVGPILYDGSVIYKNSTDNRIFRSLEDIKNKGATCAIQRGVSETELFKSLDIPFYETNTQEQALDLLIKGRSKVSCTPIAIMNLEMLLDFSGHSMSEIAPMSFQLKTQPIYMAFSPQTHASVITKWQKALDSIDRINIINQYVPFYTEEFEKRFANNYHAK